VHSGDVAAVESLRAWEPPEAPSAIDWSPPDADVRDRRHGAARDRVPDGADAHRRLAAPRRSPTYSGSLWIRTADLPCGSVSRKSCPANLPLALWPRGRPAFSTMRRWIPMRRC